MQISRRELERLAEAASNIPTADSPMQQSWVTEALEGGGDGQTADAHDAAGALYRVVGAVEDFANAICAAVHLYESGLRDVGFARCLSEPEEGVKE